VLKACRSAFVAVGLLSGLINILMLTSSVYMLNVYDRVLASGSIPTLLGLSILAAFAYLFLALLEAVRGRVLTRIGLTFEESLNLRVFDALVCEPLVRRTNRDDVNLMRDLDQVRGFLGSNGATALFDIPWLPFYLAICFSFHYLLGIAISVGAVILLIMASIGELATKANQRDATQLASERFAILQGSRQNADAVVSMGMIGARARRWLIAEFNYIDNRRAGSDLASDLGAVTRVLRMGIQSGVLAVGAYLVINQSATGGIMIASSILSARALAPIELSLAHWKGFVSARQSWRRLTVALDTFRTKEPDVALPYPQERVFVDGVSIVPPGGNALAVKELSFMIEAGEAVAVIGPSASGKSSLAKSLVGLWPVSRGKIRVDGAALDQWSNERRGRFIGYLPQDVELLSGTVAENISRFYPDAESEDIIEAAKAAGIHEMIVALSDGYQTRIGEEGVVLSGGQKQRLGLARALYNQPFLVVLDEPNSNLDAEGEAALATAIASVKTRGGVVVVIAHRPAVVASVDKILIMRNGSAVAFGPRDQIMARMNGAPPPAPRPPMQPGQPELVEHGTGA
jgi:ATP-binding cassette subfamily C protein